MLYPRELKKFFETVTGSLKHKFTRSGNISKTYSQFLNLCNRIGYDSCEFDNHTFSTIGIAISHSLDLPTCVCGKSTKFGMSSDGEYYPMACSLGCRSKDKRFLKSLSSSKIQLYSDKNRKDQIELKKTLTCKRNNGVSYPMQNLDIFLKHQNSCFKKNGKLQGYESAVYPVLTELYEDLVQGAEYLKFKNLTIEWTDDRAKVRKSYPDFFSKEINSFIEIKSEYTYNLGRYKLEKCRETLYKMKYGYIILILKPKKFLEIRLYNKEFID